MMLAAVLAGAQACAHRNPFQERREWQEGQAKAQAPVEMQREDRSWRAYRTARVRVYVDPAFTKAEGNATSHCTELFTRANDTLEPALGMHIELEEVRELPAEARGSDLEGALTALARHDAGEDVDFVLALLGSQPIATLSFHDIGRAGVLGRHLALRSMSNAEELRAIETFDALDPEERSRLYQQRKRHKESMVLLHELGHVLGALHSVSRSEVMHPSYDKAMQGFSPSNVEIMRLVLAERGQPAEERDFTALVKQIKAQLEQSQEGVFIEEVRASYIASLDAAVARPKKTCWGSGPSTPSRKSARR
jgi:hypothetical protein